MLQSLKRKSPYASPTPGPSTNHPGGGGGGSGPRGVKTEMEDVKRFKPSGLGGAGPTARLSAVGMVNDPRTAAAAMSAYLKNVGTLGWQGAYFHVQSEYPMHDSQKVLDILKGLERVEFNDLNQVFTYIPELTITTEAQLRTYIRTNSTSTTGVPIRDLREALPPNGLTMVEDLEKRGDVQIMRALTGSFKEAPLPRLGQTNSLGLKINDGGSSGNQRLKTVWWDELRERERAGERVDDEFIVAWDQVPIAETDDVVKLLEKENLGASSSMPPAPKVVASGPAKKKPQRRRQLKITNSHMKEQGIDFSRDYEQPS